MPHQGMRLLDRVSRYPFDKMTVGESFPLKHTPFTDRILRNVHGAALRFRRAHGLTIKMFAVRVARDPLAPKTQTRVWRVK